MSQLKLYRYNNRKQLLDHDYFYLMSESSLDSLAAKCLVAEYQKGETIVPLWEHPMNKLYLVISGQVSVKQPVKSKETSP